MSVGLVLLFTTLFKCHIKFIEQFIKKYTDNKNIRTEIFLLIFKGLRFIITSLFCFAFIIAGISIFGLYTSDTPVNTAYVFVLIVPMLLKLRLNFSNLIKNISKYKQILE